MAVALKKILLVVNPQAGGGRARRLLPAIEQDLATHVTQLQVFRSTSPGSIREWLAGIDLAGIDAVVAAGGDGTLFETLNGLMCHSPGSRPPLGVLPIGTGNAFSRDIGLRAGDWQSGVKLILKGRTRQLDLGQVDCAEGRIYFLNIAGMGFVVDAGLTARKLKGIGRIAYTLSTLWQTLKLRNYLLHIEVDGTLVEQDNLFVEVSNSRYTGTSFLIAPDAKLDDGLLDLTMLRALPRSRLLRLFPSIYSGGHIDYPEVTVAQGSTFNITEPVAYPMMIDGEFIGTTPARICCLPGELCVFA
jgi:diacylglycerol kinase (ATP)